MSAVSASRNFVVPMKSSIGALRHAPIVRRARDVGDSTKTRRGMLAAKVRATAAGGGKGWSRAWPRGGVRRRKIPAAGPLIVMYALGHESEVGGRKATKIGENGVEIGARNAEPFPERRADLVDRSRRNPRAVVARVVRSAQRHLRIRAVHVAAAHGAAEYERVATPRVIDAVVAVANEG